jgi:hypothetical protein
VPTFFGALASCLVMQAIGFMPLFRGDVEGFVCGGLAGALIVSLGATLGLRRRCAPSDDDGHEAGQQQTSDHERLLIVATNASDTPAPPSAEGASARDAND